MARWPGSDAKAVYVPAPVPATRETAAELRARIAAARVREGLNVSDEILALIVGDSAESSSPGIFTPDERADIGGDGDRVARARAVLEGAGEVLGGLEVCWVGGRRGVRVLVTAELARYRRLLSEQIDPARLVIERTSVSERELAGLADRVRSATDALAAEGIFPVMYGPTIGGFEIEYLAWDRDRAERLLRERFGEMVNLRYRGATLHTFRVFPFGSWLAEEDRLHVFYGLPRNGEQPASCQAFEDDRVVVVALTIRDWRGGKTLVGGFTPAHATVQLNARLGDRVVIDDAENRARPHWKDAAGEQSTASPWT